MDILDRIDELLFNGRQELLALKMHVNEAEISECLSGYQNFTLETPAKLQVAFGESIIAVSTNTTDILTGEGPPEGVSAGC
jgi:plasmid maintenance system antidote protein VapI